MDGCSVDHLRGAHRLAHCQQQEDFVEAHDVTVLELRNRVADEDRCATFRLARYLSELKGP